MAMPELVRDERFNDGYRRWKNQYELEKIISGWASTQNHIELMHHLQKVDVIACPIYCGEELYNDPQLRERGFFAEIEHPVTGRRELPGVFAKLSETPGAIQAPDPLLGEHNDWLLKELLEPPDSK